jgi:uncharacterized membrane protein
MGPRMPDPISANQPVDPAREDADIIPISEPGPTRRLEVFSDGVFAIIMTLLVLDVRVPRGEELAGGGLGTALLERWPSYVAFLVSFLLVSNVWLNHYTMFRLIRRADHRLIVLNTLLLLCVAVLPFTTALLAEYARGTASERGLSALVYSGALVVGGVFFNAVWWHALRAGLTPSAAAAAELRLVGRHWLAGPVLYAVAFALAWVSVTLSLALYAALIVYFAISGPWLARRLARVAGRGVPDAEADA